MSFLVHDFSVKNLFSSFSITSLSYSFLCSRQRRSFISSFYTVLINFLLGRDVRTERGSTIKAHNWLWVNFLWFLFLNMYTSSTHDKPQLILYIFHATFFHELFRGCFWREKICILFLFANKSEWEKIYFDIFLCI